MWRRTKSSDDMGTALESGGSSPSEPTAIEDAEGTENTAASPGIQTESEEVRPAGRVSFSQDGILWSDFQASSAIVDADGDDAAEDYPGRDLCAPGSDSASALFRLKELLPWTRSRSRVNCFELCDRRNFHPVGRDWTSSCSAAARPGREP